MKSNYIQYYVLLILLIIFIVFLFYLRNKEGFDGVDKMKQYNVIFAGTCRDVADNIEQVLSHIEKCSQKFNSHCVVIYENDSSDETRELLNKNKKPNYHYIFEDNIKETRRTKRIERGRNLVLDKIRELNKDNKYQYLIILDLDDVNKNGHFVDTIDTCFTRDDWDVVTANQKDKYYDFWAFRNSEINYDCWFETEGTRPTCDKYKNAQFPPGMFIEVDSAFGGTAIYKLSSIPDSCRYNGEFSDGQQKCEHVDFNKCIKDNGGKIFINTDFINEGKNNL